ncbi:MAG: hypothetical protein NVS3B21_23470 [Acidimicrobiales bacterium]
MLTHSKRARASANPIRVLVTLAATGTFLGAIKEREMNQPTPPSLAEFTDDDYTDLYSRVCDAVERNWHNRPTEPHLALDLDDGMCHTSGAARETALALFNMFGVTLAKPQEAIEAL